MFGMRKIIFLLVISFSVTSVSFAQEQKQSERGSGPTPEQLIENMQKEKEKTLQSGDKGKTEAIDSMVKDFKAGKITAEQIMKQGPQDKSTQGSSKESGGYPQKGGEQSGKSYDSGKQGSSQGKGEYKQETAPFNDYEKEGVPTKEKVLKELQKLKEKAINSDNMEEAKRLHSEIENIRKGKSVSVKPTEKSVEGNESQGEQDVDALKSQEKGKFLQQISQEESGLTKEKAIKKMQKMKEEAIKAGDMEKAKEIHSELQNISKMDASSFGSKEVQTMDTSGMKERAIKGSRNTETEDYGSVQTQGGSSGEGPPTSGAPGMSGGMKK